MYGQNKQRVQTEALVTMNAGNGKKIIENRKEQLQSDPANVFGTNLLRGHNHDDVISVRPWQLAMVHRNANLARTAPGLNMHAKLLEPFTSFNLSKRMSAQKAKKTYRPMGWVCDYHVFGEIAQNDSGLALIQHGSFPGQNTSLKPWTPGDILCWKPYEENDDKRDVKDSFVSRRKAQNYESADFTEDYFPAIVEPCNPVEMAQESLMAELEELLARPGLIVNLDSTPQDLTRVEEMLASDFMRAAAIVRAMDLTVDPNSRDFQITVIGAFYTTADKLTNPDRLQRQWLSRPSILYAADLLYEGSQNVVGVAGSFTKPGKHGIVIN